MIACVRHLKLMNATGELGQMKLGFFDLIKVPLVFFI